MACPCSGNMAPAAPVQFTIGKSGANNTLRFSEVAGATSYHVYGGTLASLGSGVYNHGANLNPDREVGIMPLPFSVRYDPEKQTATVYFQVRQNANGDGRIDPSHWVFQFGGRDASGNLMDRRGDQYSGYVKSAF